MRFKIIHNLKSDNKNDGRLKIKMMDTFLFIYINKYRQIDR